MNVFCGEDIPKHRLPFCRLKSLIISTGVLELPKGRCVFTYHTGDYLSIGRSYERILEYCRTHHFNIVSDSYEFAINDYLSTADESEYITKILFYIA